VRNEQAIKKALESLSSVRLLAALEGAELGPDFAVEITGLILRSTPLVSKPPIPSRLKALGHLFEVRRIPSCAG
jgi:hypothetical protein